MDARELLDLAADYAEARRTVVLAESMGVAPAADPQAIAERFGAGLTDFVREQAGGAITNMEPGKRGMRVYFDVDEINAGAARVKELGGEADEPRPVPGMGWFATCKDPQGTEFGLWQNDPSAPA